MERYLVLEEGNMECLARVVFDSVRTSYVERYIRRYIEEKKVQSELGASLLNKIKNKSQAYIEEDKNIEDRVIEDISKYIYSSGLVNIYGFMRFRLGYYRDFIESSVERAVCDLDIDLKYENLREAIRYLGEIQNSRQKKMSIIFTDKGYNMVDENGENIDSNLILEVARELGIDDLDKEETIVGSLIANAPDKIHIYREDDVEEDIISIIEEIFKGKVKIYGSYSRKLKIVKENI